VVIYPQSNEQWNLLARFLKLRAGVEPSADLKLMAWAQDNAVKIVVGFNGFIGKICNMHTAYAEDWHFTPRDMLYKSFDYAFNFEGREKILGIVNSHNAKAMKFDAHLGFKEEHRLPGLHDNGGDVVILSMTRAQCKYLEPDHGRQESTRCA
jgi:hypothetical protein